MKKSILFFIGWISCLTGTGQVNLQWQTRYTSSGSNTDKAEDMVIDTSRNVYVTGIGRIAASTNFDYVTIKYNSAGVQQWISRYDGVGAGLDQAHAIAVDELGNVYVTGLSYGGVTPGYNYATVKYNSAGVQQWAATYNNTSNGSDEAWDIAVDALGNVYVTGTSDGAGTNSAATTIKYNSAGVQQWVQRYNGAGNDIDACYAICLDATANVYVTGTSKVSTAADFDYVTIKYNTAGTQLWARNYNGASTKYDEARAITVDITGNVYVTGYSQTAVLTNFNFATVKYDVAGTQQWARIYEGTGADDDRANAIKLDAAGNVYVTGYSVGAGIDAQDMLTVKYNNSGTEKWVNRYNGTSNGYDEATALTIDGAGGVYITGYSNNTGSVSDYTTIKYDSTGIQKWLIKYNGTANNADQAAAIAVDPGGNVYVSGFSKGAGSIEDYETIKYCQLTANAGNDTSICKGSSATLKASATGAVSYAWTPAAGLSSTTSSNPVATPTITTTYIVSITNGSGCVDVDTVVVTVVDLPLPTITPSGPTSFCIGDSVKLTASTSTSYLWSTSSTLQTIKVVSSGTYSVTVKNSTGCSGTASRTVTVNPLPVISAGTNKNLCLGSSVGLLATGGSTYAWDYGNTLSDSTIANPSATPVVTTTYTVTGTSAAGCINTSTVRITVLPVPAIDAGLNNNVCEGSSVNLQATGGVSYVWTPATGLSSTTISNPVASPTATTTYTVVGTGANGCTKSDVVKITVLTLPVVDAGLDDSICAGSSANLQATGGLFYSWSPGNTLDDSTIFDPIASPVTTTTYTVTGTGANACTNTDIVKVKVFPMPTTNAGPDGNVCVGSSTQLLASGATTYVWRPGATLSDSTIVNPLASPAITTTYTVVGTNPGGCKKSDVVIITVRPKPSGTVTANGPTSFCIGDSVKLTAAAGNTYQWSTSSTSQTITAKTTATYTVTVTNTFGCFVTASKDVTANPIPVINAGLDDIVCKGSSIQLQATGGLTYVWHFAKTLNDSLVSNPVATPTVTTTYTVIGTGPGGCKSTDMVKITVINGPLVNAGVDDSVCLGSTVQLQATGATSYVWHPGATLNDSTISNPIATISGITNYTVVGTSTGGCKSNDVVKISLLSAPAVPTISRIKDSLFINNTATSYQWYRNGVLIPGETKKYHIYTQNGNYTVKVFNVKGCSTTSAPINVTDVGVGEINDPTVFAIYPNPTTDNVTFELNLIKTSDVKINLTNIAGQLVFTEELNQFTGTYKKQINLQQNAKGVYHLQIITNDRVINKKIVKE